MNNLNLVGIDVSAKVLAVMVEVRKETKPLACFDNTPSGHKKLISFITKRGRKARVCLEATGIYHFNLSLTLFNHPKIEIMVANPRAIKNFAMAMMERAKTDKVDATIILEYLKRMDFRMWQPPTAKVLELRTLTRRLRQLKNEKIREKNRRHANDHNGEAMAYIENDIEVNVRHLERRIDKLQDKGRELISQDDKLQHYYNLLTSTTGIASVSAIDLLSELMSLPDDMAADQWVAHAGLDPRAKESGTSLKKPRHISKQGNKHLRTALYMPALVAVQADPNVKSYYEKQIARGKRPMVVNVAVMRKLLVCIWGMFKSGKPWNGELFCTLKKQEISA